MVTKWYYETTILQFYGKKTSFFFFSSEKEYCRIAVLQYSSIVTSLSYHSRNTKYLHIYNTTYWVSYNSFSLSLAILKWPSRPRPMRCSAFVCWKLWFLFNHGAWVGQNVYKYGEDSDPPDPRSMSGHCFHLRCSYPDKKTSPGGSKNSLKVFCFLVCEIHF